MDSIAQSFQERLSFSHKAKAFEYLKTLRFVGILFRTNQRQNQMKIREKIFDHWKKITFFARILKNIFERKNYNVMGFMFFELQRKAVIKRRINQSEGLRNQRISEKYFNLMKFSCSKIKKKKLFKTNMLGFKKDFELIFYFCLFRIS